MPSSDVRELADPIDDELVDNEVDLEQTLDSISEVVTVSRPRWRIWNGAVPRADRGPGPGHREPATPTSFRVGNGGSCGFPTRLWHLTRRQLDFFGIEIAAAGGGRPEIDYASNLSQPKPTRRTGTRRRSDTLYLDARQSAA